MRCQGESGCDLTGRSHYWSGREVSVGVPSAVGKRENLWKDVRDTHEGMILGYL